ncbi:3'-5' exonuclease [candidate division NPL-UPA2 bacterium]|nr:3'-5' exonuclease [candidate division NPL-UPA2 bacterium]
MLKRNIKDATFAFFDVETTGLDPYCGDKVCEVAILKIYQGREVASFHSLVDPGRRISPGACAVNGITPEMLKGKPKFNQIATGVLELFEGAVIVCHNAPFDMKFLKAELNEVGLSLPAFPVIDTLTLARKYFRFSSNSLGMVAKSLKIKVSGEHRAMSDCLTTQKVLQKFIESFEGRGITALDEIPSL